MNRTVSNMSALGCVECESQTSPLETHRDWCMMPSVLGLIVGSHEPREAFRCRARAPARFHHSSKTVGMRQSCQVAGVGQVETRPKFGRESSLGINGHEGAFGNALRCRRL